MLLCDTERLMSISSTEQIIFPLTASVQFLMRVLRFLVVVKRHWINPTPSVKVFGDILPRLLPCPNRSRGDCSRLPSARNCLCNRENFRSCYFRVFKYIIKKEEFYRGIYSKERGNGIFYLFLAFSLHQYFEQM